MGVRQVRRRFVDGARGARVLETLLWLPEGERKVPLLLYCHGTAGQADEARYLVKALAERDYLVAAPEFPLTSAACVTMPDISDAGEQVADGRFLLDALTNDPEIAPRFDGRIGCLGHSLGAITCWFLSVGSARDVRIDAVAMLGAGDPVRMAATGQIGIAAHAPTAAVPALLVSGDEDLFACMNGPAGTAFPRLQAPKFEAVIAGGTHIWFKDGKKAPRNNRNPDYFWLRARVHGFEMPAGFGEKPLIGPRRQQEITLAAVCGFFDAYLKGGDVAALTGIAARFPEVRLSQAGA